MTLAMNICIPTPLTHQSTSCGLTLNLFVTSVWTLWFLASYLRTRHQTDHGSPPTLKEFVDERSELMLSIAEHAHHETLLSGLKNKPDLVPHCDKELRSF